MRHHVFVDEARKYEHDRTSMLRLRAFVFGVCLSASSVAWADTPADQTPDTEREADFNLLVTMGNRAYLARRYDEAATAYKLALDKKPDAVISGRFGLMLMKLGQIDRAAEELHEAFERGQGVTLQERREVAAAYDKAKSATTRVSVTISQVGAKVTCDDQPWNRAGTSSFWRFVMPGEHMVRAKLDGYEEAVESFTAKAGDEITISLKLVPLAAPKLPELPATIAHETRTFPPYLPASNVADDPNYSSKEDPFYGEPKETKSAKKKSGPRFSVTGGVVTVFGVASWNPAVGGVVGVAVRPHENVSIGLEGRAAWLTTSVADRPINAMTAGGLLSLCGHLKWFFACPIGHLGVIRTEGVEATFNVPPFNFFRPGLGGRLGVRFRPTERLSLQATTEALALTYRTRIFVGNKMILDQPAAMIGTQITGEWEF